VCGVVCAHVRAFYSQSVLHIPFIFFYAYYMTLHALYITVTATVKMLFRTAFDILHVLWVSAFLFSDDKFFVQLHLMLG